MWKELAFSAFSLFVGALSGVALTIAMLRPVIGDDYEIIKPKVKGTNNELEVSQYNSKDNKEPKRKLFGRIINIKKKRND